MRNKVGLKANLKAEPIKSNKKWNKSRVKEIVNEKIKEFNDFLNKKGFDDMNLRKPFFEDLASLRDKFNPKERDLEALLGEIEKRFKELMDKFNEKNLALKAENEALNELCDKLENQNELLKDENSALWQKATQRYNLAKFNAQNSQNDLNTRLNYFDELKYEINDFKENKELGQKFFESEFKTSLWQFPLDSYLTSLESEFDILKQAQQGYNVKKKN